MVCLELEDRVVRGFEAVDFVFFGDFFDAGDDLVLLTLAEDPWLRLTAVLRSTVFFTSDRQGLSLAISLLVEG